jgi:hypothetical protein
MPILKKLSKIGMSLCLLFVLLHGCSTAPEPYIYEPSNELKPGRGLFSGEDGVFTIVSVEAGADDEETEKPADSDKKNDNNDSIE